MNMATSTAGRFLRSLLEAGAVMRSADGVYSIGPSIHELAGGAPGQPDLLPLAATHISALAKLTGETAGIAAAIDDDVLHLGQVSSDVGADVQVRDWTGEQVPAHAGCTGLVLMAYWPKTQLDSYLSHPLKKFSDRTVVDAKTICSRLDHIRRDGHLWTTDEYAVGVTSAAAPVFDRAGKIVAALHVFGPAYRFPNANETGSIAEELCHRAELLSASLGHRQNSTDGPRRSDRSKRATNVT
jgi:DNA-binding IclR family transcriptional regulator